MTEAAAGGGIRATGVVRNEGREATRSVVAGEIALRSGWPAVGRGLDTTDVGRVDAGEARRLTTDAKPGGPPVTPGSISELVRVAFEADLRP